MALRSAQRLGDGFVVIEEDGTRTMFYPVAGSALWLPHTSPGTPDPNPDPTEPPDPVGDSPYKWPMNPSALNTRNGRPQDGYMTAGRPTHNGVDMSFPPAFYDGMPIRSIADGTVIRAYWEPGGGGYAVEVRHSARWGSGYYHARRDSFRVRNGDSVKQGQHLMDAGATGTATGPHLHFMMIDYTTGTSWWNSHVDPEIAMATLNPNDEYV